MAMLAEPRRKQKVINLRAKSNAWSNDANKFGQRMLEKMGWSSGKGLGAKENGIVEHVVAKYKNDDRGLGFEDKNDQWTKHEDDFNALLANLSNGDNNDEKLHSGISLEDKSKKSKARVHYHKFTRGKDLTKYSEKDLANIFGKKSFKNEEKPEEVLQDDIITTEQVFTEKGSMEDYFKNKLAAFKSKTKLSYNNLSKQEDCDAGYRFQGFSGTNNDEPESHNGFGYQSFSSYGNDENESKNENSVTEDIVSIKTTKKSKKKKKHQDEELLIQEENCDIHSEDCKINKDIDRSTIHEQNIKTKKKKRKNKEVAEENFEIKNNYEQDKDEAVVQIKEPVVANKKSKKKNKELEEIEHVIEDDLVPKKKKKRKCVDREN